MVPVNRSDVLVTALLLFAVVVHGCESTRIHLVPHSHDDVGWLKTPAQYYYGWNNSIQHANVRLIYTSAVDALIANANRTFIAVEMAFFSKWYYEQSQPRKIDVQRLVATGQLQFAGGGWCSHDEATTTFHDMLEQMTVGQQFIAMEFGVDALPRIQWQVDPFGHSAGQVLILSQASDVEALYFSRIDYQDFTDRQRTQSREFFWMPSPSLGEKAVVFASMMLHGTYCPPFDLNFDILLNEPTVVDNECSDAVGGAAASTASACSDEQNTALSWVERVSAMIGSDWDVTSGDDIMWTMGCDFTFMQAETWFANMERIQHLVGRFEGRSGSSLWSNMSVVYATPQSYTEARLRAMVQGATDDAEFDAPDGAAMPPLKEGDFFPYADGPHMFWTGYFTSRPTFKRLVRIASGMLVALNQVMATIILNGEVELVNTTVLSGLLSATKAMREAVAQSQHHDAITGTAKQHVSFDYTKTIAGAMDTAVAALSVALTSASSSGEEGGAYTACFLANESICSVSQHVAPFHVIGWNSRDGASSVGRGLLLELPVTHDEWLWTAVTHSGAPIDTTAIVVDRLSPCVSSTTQGCAPLTALVRLLNVSHAAPFILSATPVMSRLRDISPSRRSVAVAASKTPGVVETDAIRMIFDTNTGSLVSIKNKRDNVERDVTLKICYYVGSTGDQQSRQASGAYIFRPVSDECVPVWGGTSNVTTTIVRSVASDVVIVFDQNITEWLSLRWFVFSDEPRVEVELSMTELPTANPLNASQHEGRELVLRWVTNISSADTMWTDSNGLELIPRRRNTNPHMTEHVAGNYFPVTSAALIRDASAEWLMVPDAAVGCASLQSGQLECMVHRRLLVDDGRGVGEALNETEFVTPYTNCALCRDEIAQGGGCCGVHYGKPMPLRRRFVVSLHSPTNTTWRRFASSNRRQPLLLFGNGVAPPVGAGNQRIWRPRWNATALPTNVTMDSIEVPYTGANTTTSSSSLWIRLAHIGSCHSSASCGAANASFELLPVFPSAVSVTRMTLLFTKPWEAASNRTVAAGRESNAWDADAYARPTGHLDSAEPFLVTMFPMEVHAYNVRFA